MKTSTYKTLVACATLPILLAACNRTPVPGNNRVELPQQYRLAQSDFATALERRVGKIAVALEDGNVAVMDQTGGNVVRITQDATRQLSLPDSNGKFTVYQLPVWAPSGDKLALVEVTARPPEISSTIELSPESVTIERGPNSSIVTESADGQDVQRVQPGTRTERRPDVVIIRRGLNSGQLLSSAVYVASADGKRPLKELYLSNEHEVSYMDWSPSGDKLAFLSRNPANDLYAMHIVNANGGKSEVLFKGSAAAWHWNPDGNTMVTKVSDGESGKEELALVDTQSNSTTPIATKGEQAFVAPSFSPDGHFMLLTERLGSKSRLVLADRAGNPKKELTSFEGNISFSWSPAGAKLAYVVQAANAKDIGGALHVLDANSGENKVLSRLPVVAFFWSPDGHNLAVFSRARPSEVDPNFPGLPIVPPSATFIYLLQTINVGTKNARQLFYFQPTEAFRHLTTEFDRYARAVNIWSPDSAKLVFTLTWGNGTQSADFVLETESSGSIYPRVLTRGSLAFWSPK